MSKTYELLVQYANTMPEEHMDEQLRLGIEGYLKEHQLFNIEDASDAEFEILMFKQMSPTVFKAFFAHYADRELLERISAQTKDFAIQRAVNGEAINTETYQPMAQQLLNIAVRLSQDEENSRWLTSRLNTAMTDLKFAAGLSAEVSEDVAQELCK